MAINIDTSAMEGLRMRLLRHSSEYLPFPFVLKLHSSPSYDKMAIDVCLRLTAPEAWATDRYNFETGYGEAGDFECFVIDLGLRVRDMERSLKAYRQSRLWC